MATRAVTDCDSCGERDIDSRAGGVRLSVLVDYVPRPTHVRLDLCVACAADVLTQMLLAMDIGARRRWVDELLAKAPGAKPVTGSA